MFLSANIFAEVVANSVSGRSLTIPVRSGGRPKRADRAAIIRLQ